MHRSKRLKPVLLFYLKIGNGWESKRSIKTIGTLLLIAYLVFLFAIVLKRNDYFVNYLYYIPDNPYKAIEFAFTLLLFFEVVNLVFAIEKSLSESMIIQLEILSLILLRSAFKKFGDIDGIMNLSALNENILYVFTDAGSALLIFIGIMIIKIWDKPLPSHMDISKLRRFINIKRLLALLLLFVFVITIIYNIVLFFVNGIELNFFKEFYTIMIFTDILIVFISLRYSNSYFNLFRNSCFAFATVIIRLALSSSAPYNALMGIIATVFVVLITLTYNKISRLEIK